MDGLKVNLINNTMLIQTAFKNIIRGGKRTWLNVVVLSFVLVIMVAYNGLLDGWLEESRRDTIDWESGWSQLWHPKYDKYDIFTLQDAHGIIPEDIKRLINKGVATPILVIQASIYPHGRMQNIVLKGINTEQNILKIPSEKIKTTDDNIPAMIGTRMAKSTDLKKGDRIMLRWRDKNGVFDSRQLLITHIFETKVGSVDSNQIWINLDDLYQMTGMSDEATYIVFSKDAKVKSDISGWKYKSNYFLLSDVRAMENAERVESTIIFIILLALALLAVYDTQTLSIFRRQKEIGTYVALGMTPKKVTSLFTFEGTIYSVLAVLFAAIWGTPLLYLFAKTGLPMPEAYTNIGLTLGEAIYPIYKIASLIKTILLLIVLSAIISYIPAQKIAKQNIVYALKGKIN